jgi:hypothetical protein
MKGRSVIGLVALVAMLAAGCASAKEETHLTQGGGMYSSLDATAQVYSNPRSQAAIEDNPWRWLGIVLHPFGVMLDYTINRPFYTLASTFPDTFGYTSEDVLIESQRRR